MLLHVVCTLTASAAVALPAALAVAQQPLATAGACADDLEQAVALLQTGGRQLRRASAAASNAKAEALPVLRPYGHSYFSTNPEASAEYFTRYFRLARREEDGCGGRATHVRYCPKPNQPCMAVTFVNDQTKAVGPLDPSLIVNVSDAEWDRVAAQSSRHESTYSPWVDFHDGWRGEDFNDVAAFEDGLGVEFYGNVLRMGLPGTMWTIELHSYSHILKAAFRVESPDVCRDLDFDRNVAKEHVLDEIGNGWWKATFGSPDPLAAADFAVQALGAIWVQGPFPDPKQDDCAYVQWVVLPDGLEGIAPDRPSGFMLHFVQEPKTAFDRGNITVEHFAKMQEKLRDLEAGVFDAYMYNSLILWADTLDPYVERFRSLNVPFLPLRGPNGHFSVFVNVPGNGIPLQLRSSVLTAATPVEMDICW